VTIQMKATEQYFPVVLFIILYKVVLTFESVDEILKCDHSDESYWVVLSCGALYYAVQGGSNFWVCGWHVVQGGSSFKVCGWLFKTCGDDDDEIVKCEYLNKSHWAVLLCGAVCLLNILHCKIKV